AATVVALAAATAAATLPTAAAAEEAPARPAAVDRHDPQPTEQREHDLDGPLSKTQEAQRQEALNQLISGDATVKDRDGSKVVALKGEKGDTKYVELG
ncbi:protease, partial [Streptomyces sp. TRM76130]|nr:protease [Streptomyces sp. TRM76130]